MANIDYRKQYRLNNKDKISKWNKTYYRKHKNDIIKKQKIRLSNNKNRMWYCDVCDKHIKFTSKYSHNKRISHINAAEFKNEENNYINDALQKTKNIIDMYIKCSGS